MSNNLNQSTNIKPTRLCPRALWVGELMLAHLCLPISGPLSMCPRAQAKLRRLETVGGRPSSAQPS